MNIQRAIRFTLKTAPFLAVVLAATEAHAQCPPGYRLNRWGRCVPGRVLVPRGCPPGYVMDRFGRCMQAAVIAPTVCPAGYTMNRFGRCVPAVVAPRVCPPGYFYFRGRCIIRR